MWERKLITIKATIRGGKTRPSAGQSRFGLILAVLVLVGGLLFGYIRSRPDSSLYTGHHLGMDTLVELRFFGPDGASASELSSRVFEEIDELEALFSRTETGSIVSSINDNAGHRPVPAGPSVYAVLEKALEYARLSEGAFDPTVGPLLDAWGFLNKEPAVPAPAELKSALRLVDYRFIELDPEEKEIFLTRRGMVLDLGGIAKGYIVDRALALLQAEDVEHAYINAGGDIGLIGTRPDGEPWRIGIRHPRREGELLAVLSLSGGAVVTSGDYERAFTEGDVRYHHILDPRTGMPAAALASVTITAESVLEADALATAIFVLGPESGMQLIEALPAVEGVLVKSNEEVIVSPGLRDAVELTP